MHITIIAKSPVAGLVKTRMCPPCTYDQAAEIAAAALADTFDAVETAVADTSLRRVLLLDGERPAITPTEFEVVAQRGDGLEQRLSNGFADLGPGVIVGMETPHAAARLGEAVHWLHRGVDVIGLATDGGYWCIGLASVDEPSLASFFDGMPMSRSHTGLAQLRRLHRLARPVRLLSMSRDLDSIQDLHAAARSNRRGRLGAVAAAVIASLA